MQLLLSEIDRKTLIKKMMKKYNTFFICTMNPQLFQREDIICSEGNKANFFCIDVTCDGSSFICEKGCACWKPHEKCCIKNIPKILTGIANLLKRHFSRKLKGEGIQVMNRVATKTKANSVKRFCLTYYEMEADVPARIEMKVNCLKSCVGIGLMHKPTLQLNQFEYIPDNQFINHGSFMVLSNGYKYSHTNPQQNFQEVRNISMKTGDYIELVYERGQLYFKQYGNVIALSIPSINQLYFGVYLFDEGDSVEILTEK